jgi:hypothetical protein
MRWAALRSLPKACQLMPPQVKDADTLPTLSYAGQAREVARVEHVQVGLVVLILGAVGAGRLLFGQLLVAGEEYPFSVCWLALVALAGILHQGLHAQCCEVELGVRTGGQGFV